MTSDGHSFSRLTCGVRAAVVAALVHLASPFVQAAAPVASVVAVQPTRIADLVMLNGGFDAGLRQGMICRVTRGSAEIAEILLVDLCPTCSAALIVSVAPKQSIRASDVAAIKVLKS